MAKAKVKKEGVGQVGPGTIVKNKKAWFEYEILEKYEAGLVLKGAEVKSLRLGRVSLQEAYIDVRSGEALLVGCTIEEYKHKGYTEQDPLRHKKLLLKKRQVRAIEASIGEKGLTVIPLSLFFNARGKAKLEIAVARGKKQHDKRATQKDREQERAVRRFLKNQ